MKNSITSDQNPVVTDFSTLLDHLNCVGLPLYLLQSSGSKDPVWAVDLPGGQTVQASSPCPTLYILRAHIVQLLSPEDSYPLLHTETKLWELDYRCFIFNSDQNNWKMILNEWRTVYHSFVQKYNFIFKQKLQNNKEAFASGDSEPVKYMDVAMENNCLMCYQWMEEVSPVT